MKQKLLLGFVLGIIICCCGCGGDNQKVSETAIVESQYIESKLSGNVNDLENYTETDSRKQLSFDESKQLAGDINNGAVTLLDDIKSITDNVPQEWIETEENETTIKPSDFENWNVFVKDAIQWCDDVDDLSADTFAEPFDSIIIYYQTASASIRDQLKNIGDECLLTSMVEVLNGIIKSIDTAADNGSVAIDNYLNDNNLQPSTIDNAITSDNPIESTKATAEKDDRDATYGSYDTNVGGSTNGNISYNSKVDLNSSEIFHSLEITDFTWTNGNSYGEMNCRVKNNNPVTVHGYFN